MKTNIHIRLNGKIATVLSMGKSYICSKGNPQSLKEQRLWFQRKVQEKISTLLLLAERNLLPVEGPIGGKKKKKNSRKAKPSPFLPHHFELSICFSLLLFSSFVGERSALSKV
ncbi:hypothetical protein B296_00040532 [Ensete ventricosum]|uniref:Uncharacterized protein n=1 Tax=Ensete ventricosum TaxID=4639 RepID=A0A426YGX1_ENSVE|nr:hypothetical protein B296_00040532 [Ensete ventricosum]